MNSQTSPLGNNPLFTHAFELHQKNQLDEATKLYRQLCAAYPNEAHLWYLLGTALYQAGHVQASIEMLERTLLMRPDFFEAMNNLGNAFRDIGFFQKALDCFDRAIICSPLYADAHNNRGNVLRDLNLLEQALQSYEKALALSPNYAQAHYNCANVLQELNQLDSALDACAKAIALDKNYADAYCVQGIVLYKLNRLEESLQSLNFALTLMPTHPDANFNKALVNLTLGNFEDGWRLFEWRWKTGLAKKYHRTFSQPLWLGQHSLQNKTIFIYAEQGLGDVIQFCRYLPILKGLGAKVIIQVPNGLKSLIESLNDGSEVLSLEELAVDFDYHCPIMSLPLAFKTTPSTIPCSIPYLYPRSAQQLLWQSQLGKRGQLRVGLIWTGSATHKNDRNRSISLHDLCPLLSLPIEFHSLQKEYRGGDQELLKNLSGIDHHADLKDFSDTAALISALDLVISVDTSVAHLAGAMGKPTWLLLPFSADYRWMTKRLDSPWYPSMKLFRQTSAGEWADVLEVVKSQLIQMT